MKQLFFVTLALLLTIAAQAQTTFTATIKDHEQKPIPGVSVTIQGTNLRASSDSTGTVIIENVPAGKQTIIFSHTSFRELKKELTFPLTAAVEIEMEADEEELEDIIVTATRTSRAINNTPTRIETISGEELGEKSNMKPGEIRMLLNESTGIQTQQTSATSYSSSIRIQGLDGRYTQLLKDGLPLYAGFSGGLSIMQITPLDLQQVEVIKGSSSTLYGGGAIAGLINLVTKTPKQQRELSFIANATSALGLDLSGFYSQRFKKTGVTVFASRNSGTAYDPADIGLTAIPEFERYTINPRLFLYFNDRTDLNVGLGYITEQRTGGDINYIKKGTAGYFEKNTTNRLTGELQFAHRLKENRKLSIKASINRYDRKIEVPDYVFSGLQTSAFAEASFDWTSDKMEWIAGVNLLTDQFKEDQQPNVTLRDYTLNTFGAFVQHTWNATKWLTLESGLRGDQVNNYGFNFLPRISAMFRINEKLTSRLGGGLGYKAPTIFTEDAERMQFRNVAPISAAINKTEKSAGVNFDINYRTGLFNDAVSFSFNNLFFYTRLNDPLVLTDAAGPFYEFRNADGFIDTKGIETNLRFVYRDFKLFIGYTFAEVHQHFSGTMKWMPLTPRHRLNNVLMYEIEDKLKLGLEAYYFSEQRLNDNTMGRSYWITGFMAEKLWEKISVFINFENFLDTRQTKFDTIYTGPISNPTFRDIYAPVDGFVVNGGIKLRL